MAGVIYCNKSLFSFFSFSLGTLPFSPFHAIIIGTKAPRAAVPAGQAKFTEKRNMPYV